MVLYLVFICLVALFGAMGYFFGNFEDDEDREDFMRQINDPKARERRKKKRGLL